MIDSQEQYYSPTAQHGKIPRMTHAEIIASLIQAKVCQVEAAILNMEILKIEPERGRISLGGIEQ